MPLDLLAAVRFLQGNGVKSVSIVGASMGGTLAEEALRLANPRRAAKLTHPGRGAAAAKALMGKALSSPPAAGGWVTFGVHTRANSRARRRANPGEIDRVVFLAHGAYGTPQLLQVRKLFTVARNDIGPGNVPRLIRIQTQYDQAPEPKEIIVLDGEAHAQFLFDTDQAERLTREIIRFLAAP